MLDLKTSLKNKLSGSTKIAVLGIGSELMGDDALGVLIARELETFANERGLSSFKAFIGGASPESITGEIKRFKPTHLIIIDAAEIDEQPGAVRLIDADHVCGVSFSTHRLPTKILCDYLVGDIGCKIMIIGVQPGHMHFCEPVSKEITRVIKDVSKVLSEII